MAGRAAIKVPKGTRDFEPAAMAVRRKVFDMVSSVFEQHGAVSIETPVFELKSTLTNKYGEDSKLIYDLADQQGELLALRYDLTVPFARYLASHKVTNIRRYQIGRVYRRDNPAMNRGRFREFYQCDFDIAGTYPAMVPDSEILTVLTRQLDQMAGVSSFHAEKLGQYTIKLNHRVLLDAIFTICGVPPESLRSISSSIDKLDKEEWETVRNEMIEKKNLEPEIADKIQQFVSIKGPPMDVLKQLDGDPELVKAAQPALEELRTLFEYLEALQGGNLSRFSLDLSLARGLDYYTGIIFEAVLTGSAGAHLGSVAAGGRYDTLVGMFSGKGVPCVGCSLGIERLMNLYEAAEKARADAEAGGVLRETATSVLVATIPAGGLDQSTLTKERMRVSAELWKADIGAEFSYKNKPKLVAQLETALEAGIPVVVLFGEDELKNGKMNIKVLATKVQTTIDRADLVMEVRKALKLAEVGGA